RQGQRPAAGRVQAALQRAGTTSPGAGRKRDRRQADAVAQDAADQLAEHTAVERKDDARAADDRGGFRCSAGQTAATVERTQEPDSLIKRRPDARRWGPAPVPAEARRAVVPAPHLAASRRLAAAAES